jgi:hypothetical protein
MLPRTTDRSPGRHLLLVGALLAAAALISAGGPARAAEDVKTDTSLALIPADAAFYSATLRNKEQIDLFLKSNAYKALRALPVVKQAWAGAKDQLEKMGGPLEMYKKFTADKDNKDLVDLLIDAVSHEVFIYGGKNTSDFPTLVLKSYFAASESVQGGLQGGPDELIKGMVRAALVNAQKNRELINAPELVIGFKVKQAKKAVAQLDRLEKIATAMMKNAPPPLQGRVKRVKQGGGDFMTLQLDGEMIPWDDIPLAEFEENKGQFDDLVKHIKKLKLAFSIGVKGDYILIGLTRTAKDFAKLGGEGKKLADRPELKPLRDHAERRIVSIGYSSKELAGSIAATWDYSSSAEALKKLLNMADTLKEERKKAIEKDLDALVEDLKSLKPVYGASLSFSFLTDSGYEGFDYAYDLGKQFQGVKCTLQNHFGGNPIFAAAGGFKVDGSSYKTLVKWIKTFYNHGEAIFLDMADDEAKDIYKKGAKEILPLFQRLDDTNRKFLIPGLGNSGLGIVIDAKWTSKKWHKEMAEFDKPMPMVEVGFLLGLSDSKKFETAIKEYRITLNELLEKGRAAAPNNENIPELKIPAPESEEGKHGKFLFYAIPEEAGLDKQVQPVLGIGKTVCVLTPSKQFADRLMANSPLKVKSGPLSRKGPLVAVSVLNWNAFIDAAAPWLEEIVPKAMMGGKTAPDEETKKKMKEMAAGIVKQMRVGFQVLKAFKGATSASYVEGNALVSHHQIVIKDLPAAEEKQPE